MTYIHLCFNANSQLATSLRGTKQSGKYQIEIATSGIPPRTLVERRLFYFNRGAKNKLINY